MPSPVKGCQLSHSPVQALARRLVFKQASKHRLGNVVVVQLAKCRRHARGLYLGLTPDFMSRSCFDKLPLEWHSVVGLDGLHWYETLDHLELQTVACDRGGPAALGRRWSSFRSRALD
jgi:hypothetical protein